MAGRQPASTVRARGSITTLPSGTIRVRVYAGIDPVSGRRHYLTELVQPGKKAQREALHTGPDGAPPAAPRRVFGLATSQKATEVLTAEGLTAANIARWSATQARLDAAPAERRTRVSAYGL